MLKIRIINRVECSWRVTIETSFTLKKIKQRFTKVFIASIKVVKNAL